MDFREAKRLKHKAANHGLVILRSVTDGYTRTYIDDGQSPNTGIPGPGRANLLAALSKKSPLDGRAAFLVVDEPTLCKGCPPIDMERYTWRPEDDDRLAEHLRDRAQRTRSSAFSGIAQAQAQEAAKREEAEMQKIARVAAAAVQASQAQAQAPAQAPAPKKKAKPDAKKEA